MQRIGLEPFSVGADRRSFVVAQVLDKRQGEPSREYRRNLTRANGSAVRFGRDGREPVEKCVPLFSVGGSEGRRIQRKYLTLAEEVKIQMYLEQKTNPNTIARNLEHSVSVIPRGFMRWGNAALQLTRSGELPSARVHAMGKWVSPVSPLPGDARSARFSGLKRAGSLADASSQCARSLAYATCLCDMSMHGQYKR